MSLFNHSFSVLLQGVFMEHGLRNRPRGRCSRDEEGWENEQHFLYSWDFPKPQSAPHQEETSIVFLSYSSQGECHVRMSHLLCQLLLSADNHLG